MSELKTLEQVLQDKLLAVGDYQRPYAWDQKQLADLWSDIDLLGTLNHYTGTLVLQTTSEKVTTRSGQELVQHYIVDGQQRLTTCVILLDRLSKALAKIGLEEATEAANELTRLIEVNVDGVRKPRLRLSSDLNYYFAEGLIGGKAFEGSTPQPGQARLQKAAQFFDEEIARLTDGQSPDVAQKRLLAARTRVCYKLQFIVYNVEREDEVGVLFETVNGRGKDLTELERVKNYLLYLSRQLNDTQRDDIVETINKAWSEIFTNLGRVELREDSVLRAHWLVTEDANLRNWHGAESVKARFPRSDFVADSSRLAADPIERSETPSSTEEAGDRLYQALKGYVDTLRSSASFLSEVHDPAAIYLSFGDHAEQIRKTTGALRRSGSIAVFYPLVIAARLRFPIAGELYARLVDFCERFSARVWTISGLRSNAGISSIRWAARDIYVGKDVEQVIQRLEARLWELAPDSKIEAAFDPKAKWYPRSTAHKFLLYEYELVLKRDASDVPDFAALTIKGNKSTEHVLPQNPEDGSQWWKDFTAAQHAELVDGIGNLVLTQDNWLFGHAVGVRLAG